MKKIIRYFLQGLLIIAPSFITIYIVYLVFSVLDSSIQRFFSDYLHFSIPGMGLVVGLVLITLLGFLGQSIFFKPIQKILDRMLRKAPLVKVLYSSIKDLLSAFVGDEKKFDKPVLVKVNITSDLHKMGFLTTEDLTELNLKDKVTVYFPHSYNFSGEMFIVPRDQVTLLNISASEAMKFIVSGGVTKVWYP
ncbi:MAG: DUF502 domain-containing protein [Bacteroidales bacterium]|nr:DUF502 domain-containing protein [Bacteroidales bacterium]